MKNEFKCTLEELTVKCIFKRLVGVHTLGSWLQHSHDYNIHMIYVLVQKTIVNLIQDSKWKMRLNAL